MKPWYRIAFLGLILGACSRLQVAYRLADEYILLQANSFFDLSDDQYKVYKQRVEQDLARIKSAKIPEVVSFLKNIRQEIEQKSLTQAKVDSFYDGGQKIMSQVLHEFEKTTYDMTVEMNADQVKNFVSEYNDRLSEYREKVESPEDRYNHQRKRFAKWMKEWLGTVSRDQEKMLEDFVEAHPYPYDLQIKSRELMRDKFVEAQKNPKKLKEFLARLDEEREAQYAQALKAYTPELKKYIFQVYNSLNDYQRKYLLERLKTRIQQLDDIRKL